MYEINIAKLILDTMPPVENEIQDQLYDYLETNIAEVNKLIYSSPKYKNEATVISSMIRQLRADVCFQIFMKNLNKEG